MTVLSDWTIGGLLFAHFSAPPSPLLCEFFFPPLLRFSDNKWSVIPQVSLSPLSLDFIRHSLLPRSLTPRSLPPSLPLPLVFLACPRPPRLHLSLILLPPSSISLLLPWCFKACVSLSLLLCLTFSLFSSLLPHFFQFFFLFLGIFKIACSSFFLSLYSTCFPSHLSLFPCSSALFPVHITVSLEAQSGTDSISIEAPTRPDPVALSSFIVSSNGVLCVCVFSLGYVLSSVPPSCLTSTPCHYKTVTILIRRQAGPLWSWPFRKHALRCLEKYLTR